MSNMQNTPIVLNKAESIERGVIVNIGADGLAGVRMRDGRFLPGCSALRVDCNGMDLAAGSEVLVWLEEPPSTGAVILGCIGPVSSKRDASAKPKTLILEAEEDIVIRNSRAKLRIDSKGDIEIVCNNFTSRSQRLLRLLAPLIKLN
jgi:hypothetical protein